MQLDEFSYMWDQVCGACIQAKLGYVPVCYEWLKLSIVEFL
jgi:hypothetical protein